MSGDASSLETFAKISAMSQRPRELFSSPAPHPYLTCASLYPKFHLTCTSTCTSTCASPAPHLHLTCTRNFTI